MIMILLGIIKPTIRRWSSIGAAAVEDEALNAAVSGSGSTTGAGNAGSSAAKDARDSAARASTSS